MSTPEQRVEVIPDRDLEHFEDCRILSDLYDGLQKESLTIDDQIFCQDLIEQGFGTWGKNTENKEIYIHNKNRQFRRKEV